MQALALVATGKDGGLGATGAHVWLWSRIVYVPAYAFGIPVLRTLGLDGVHHRPTYDAGRALLTWQPGRIMALRLKPGG